MAESKHPKLIQNYGLLWERDKVGWSDYRATLQGCVTITQKPVDFRHQRGVYALYDREFRLLYVGQAGSGQRPLFTRLKEHHTQPGNRGLAARWRYFSWFGVLKVKSTKELSDPFQARPASPQAILDALEAVAIEISDPPINRQGGRFPGATAYRQYDPGEDGLAPQSAVDERSD